MFTGRRLRIDDVEESVCYLASKQLGIPRKKISPNSRIIEDLNCDSLDLIELFMEIEDVLDITLPELSERAPHPVYKAVFTRQPFRLADLAELAYLLQESGRPERDSWGRPRNALSPSTSIPFTQLGGRYAGSSKHDSPLFESIENRGSQVQYRRRSDGMRCVVIPKARVEIGNDSESAQLDEQPRHAVEIDSFLIDAEPVSTTAYCRFLNSIGVVPPEILHNWFALSPDDDRQAHMLVQPSDTEWAPLAGTERWPMILVSWYGANAYSLWANGADWRNDRDEADSESGSYLPSEAQWEYAARGSLYRPFPWGNETPSDRLLRFGQHRRGATYRAETLPLADVNAELGMSPFGLHHMAGNVWQWCRDWYEEDFYRKAEALRLNPVNHTLTDARSERGGSWLGPPDLCRSSFRRGRPPIARGRCLGFRCVSRIPVK